MSDLQPVFEELRRRMSLHEDVGCMPPKAGWRPLRRKRSPRKRRAAHASVGRWRRRRECGCAAM